MNLEKSKKRIAKKVKMGFHGYPTIGITYFGPNEGLATGVSLEFVSEEGAEPQTENFTTESDIREDETIQSAMVKNDRKVGRAISYFKRGREMQTCRIGQKFSLWN